MDMTASEGGGPYVGRRAFTVDDHDLFVGRDQEIQALRALWRSSPLVVLHGPAGSGKTSLLQAGLTPLLAEDGEVLPAGRPLGASSFPEPLLADHNPYSLAVLASWSPGESRTRLAQESITDFLHRYAPASRRWRADSLFLVAIDQIEEILVDERAGSARDELFADLASAMSEVPGLRVLLATRSDALSKLLPYEKELSPVGVVHFGLEPLTRQAAVEAIRRPMEKGGGRFDARAAEYIVDELHGGPPNSLKEGPTVQPAQLQVVCTELWYLIHNYQPLVTVGFVRDNIDVDQILANFCASVVMEVADSYRIAAEQVFEWLVLGFVTSGSAPVRVLEAELMVIGIPVGVLRMLENEHGLTAEWSLEGKQYQLADHLTAAARRLAKSRVFSQPKLDTAARMRAAESALTVGELALARYHAEEALKIVNLTKIRWRADVLSLLGNIEYRSGRSDLAEKSYQNAAELREQLGDEPEVGRLFGAIGCIHAHQGKFQRALEELHLAVTRSPFDLALQTELATALWRSGQSQAAAAVFGAVLSVEPESADALAGRGQIRAERGNATAALDDLQALRRLRPSVSQRPEVQSAYALALAYRGLSEPAMVEADAALASSNDSAVIFVRAARVALASGAVKRAKELLRQAEVASHPALSSDQRTQVRRLLFEVGESGSVASTPPMP
jgi:tetratricopeptide (TPR) repeat protein